MLASPEFVFRFERTPAGVAPGPNYRVSDLELASRLSYFLWSSAPDEQLLTARQRRASLKDPLVLESRCGACWPTRAPKRWPRISPASGCSCRT